MWSPDTMCCQRLNIQYLCKSASTQSRLSGVVTQWGSPELAASSTVAVVAADAAAMVVVAVVVKGAA